MGPSKRVKAAIRKSAKQIKRFPDMEASRLKHLFLSKLGIHQDFILFANSIKELIYFIPSVFKPTRVVIIGPALRIYEKAALAVGADVTYVTADDKSAFIPDGKFIREKMRVADMVFLANPNRVTGKLMDKNILDLVLSESTSRGVKIVLDESLIEFSEGDSYVSDIAGLDHVIVLRTTAFFYGLPGLELSCAFSSPPAINKIFLRWRLRELR
jgi:threonine-phosphate decarboxylase